MSGLIDAARAALIFYDRAELPHMPGEAKILDDLSEAIRKAGRASSDEEVSAGLDAVDTAAEIAEQLRLMAGTMAALHGDFLAGMGGSAIPTESDARTLNLAARAIDILLAERDHARGRRDLFRGALPDCPQCGGSGFFNVEPVYSGPNPHSGARGRCQACDGTGAKL